MCMGVGELFPVFVISLTFLLVTSPLWFLKVKIESLIEICGSCDGVREKELSAAKNYETAPAHVVHSRTIFEIVRLYQPSGEIQSTFQTRMSDNW